jgi:SAM-dependent methyltransferase
MLNALAPKRLAAVARGLAIDKGLVAYRRPYTLGADVWDEAWTGSELDHYADVDELPRYAVLVGYLRSLDPGWTVLDVGCGSGLMRTHIDGLDFSRYLGVDVSATAIERAAGLADDRTSFLVGELPPAETGTFDVAVLNEVLYYADDPGATLDRIAARLTPGGHVLTSIWRHPGDAALQRLLDARFERVGATEVRSRLNRRRRWRISLHRLRREAV